MTGTRSIKSHLSLATLLLCVIVSVSCADPRPNVLLVTFDTTRADRFGCYGNDAIATPVVDGLAARGVRFARAYAAVPITAPSHSTMLTGKYPIGHGVRDNGLFVLGESQTTLAEILGADGYATGAAIGAFPLLSRFGLDQGFDLYDDHLNAEREDHLGQDVVGKTRLYFDERKAARVNEAVLPWLEKRGREPFFLWVHYFDPHQPLEPPAPYDEQYAHNLYDGEIAYSDESLGILLDDLERLGHAENTLVILTADHGEGRGEHGEHTHSMLLYDSTLHVPLVVRPPAGMMSVPVGGRVIEEAVGTVDIVPTVLDLLGLPTAADLHGQTLAPAMRGDAPPPRRALYAETLSTRLVNGWAELRALRVDGEKYIHGARPQLFDLATDPGELVDLAPGDPARTDAARARMSTFLNRNAATDLEGAVPLDEETRQRLMALGYLHGSGAETQVIEEQLVEGGIAPRDRIRDISGVSLAKEYLFKQRALDAREILSELLANNPENASYREMMTSALLQLGRFDDAATELESLQADGNRVTATLVRQLARALFGAGQPARALTVLRVELDARPDAESQYLLALLLKEQDDPAARVEALEATLALDETHTEARVDLAIHWARTGRIDEARAGFERALADRPYFAEGHYNFGTFLVEHGDFAAAQARFERAVQVKPRYLQAHLALIIVRQQRGDREGARQQLDVLRGVAPGSREARMASSVLEGAS